MAFSKTATAPKQTKINRIGSPEQIDIWKALVETKSHVVVNAGPGVGKTYTCINGFQVLLDNGYQGRSAFCAFNKSIAEELGKKVPQGVACSTLHSLGYKMVMSAFGRVKVDSYKLVNAISNSYGVSNIREVPFNVRTCLEKLVPLCKSFLLDGTNTDDLSELCENYNIEVNGTRDRIFKLVPDILTRCKNETRVIDFDDMVWFPVVHDMDTIKLDLLVVDEAQDLNRVQQELVWKNASRVMLVGDKSQSIYGFRGSDARAIESFSLRLKNSERGVVELPLLVSRRCPKLHVKFAQTLVPGVQALDEAEQGVVYQANLPIATADMAPGDLVMSRCNAPLISCAYQLLRANKRVHIQGRDFGKGLENLIRKIVEIAKQDIRTCTIPQFSESLAVYENRETQRILLDNKQTEKKLDTLEDKLLCIRYLCEGLKDTGEVIDRINSIFSDDPNTDNKYIVLSSVHRAKGLEAERTFILEPEKFPHPMAKQPWEKVQELNCLFVAITRSKHSMTFVGGLPRPLAHHATSVTRRQPDQTAAIHEEATGVGEVPVLHGTAIGGSFNNVRQPQEVSQQAPSSTATVEQEVSGRAQQEASSPSPAESGRRSPRSRTANWKGKSSRNT